jgi:hypothetical protein
MVSVLWMHVCYHIQSCIGSGRKFGIEHSVHYIITACVKYSKVKCTNRLISHQSALVSFSVGFVTDMCIV